MRARLEPLGGRPTEIVARQQRLPEPVRLIDRAYQRLEEMIVTLQLPPGSTWSAPALSEMVNIGRTPVLQALQRLVLVQLVEIVPRFGIVVTDVHVPEQMLVVEARRALEPLIASRATRRSTPKEKIELAMRTEELLDVATSGNAQDYLRHHYSLRHFVVSCTHNKFLESSLSSLDALSRRFFYVHQSQPAEVMNAARLHAKVFRAIAGDNENEAIESVQGLLDHIENFTRGALVQ
ncbi:GntR family transcriptional regulator [Aminobacter sp. MSH1]|uniref:GntR family transcriptional regulator n=1 Tax=Aminobacter sp. MSH1 TaxID=374606 RepID=UPI000D3D6B0C|nr:GntR family transcriptional regulator [Aminobacter sp. MSH1]